MSVTRTDPNPPRRVLIVEDNPDGRESLRRLVDIWGFAVDVAEDGLRGVHRALEWEPHAAIVDIGLPVLDGYGVARRVREALGGRVLLIALTAYADAEARRLALDAGFDQHMAKPADLARLESLLGPA
jgi:DNA-binding response OmpR family regulator